MTIQDQIIIEMRADMRQLKRDLEAARRESKRTNNAIRSHFKQTAASIRLTQAAVAGLAATIVGEYGWRATHAVLETVDAWNLVNSRIRLVSDSSDQLLATQERLFAISQASRAHYESLADLYARIARNTRTMRIEDEKRLLVTEAIAKALIISGANAQSADAALVQFTQGLAANALRGQELNSVMEQIPRVSQAIAEGLGVQIGDLRKMAAEGKLTAEVVLNAIIKSKKEIDKEFGDMQRTMGQATVQVKNSWMRFLGALDESIGITNKVTSYLDNITEALKDQDKTVSGLQNKYIDMIKDAVVWADYWADKLVSLGVQSFAGYQSIIPALKSEYKIFNSWLDSVLIDFFSSIDEMITNMKLNTLKAVQYLTQINIGGTQVTQGFVSDEDIAKVQKELESIKKFRADTERNYLETVAIEGEKIKKMTDFNRRWIEAAEKAAEVTKKQRREILDTAEAARKAAKEFQRDKPYFTKTGPSKNQIEEEAKKKAKAETKRVKALIHELDLENRINIRLAQRVETEARIEALRKNLKEWPAKELILQKEMESELLKIKAYKKEIAALNEKGNNHPEARAKIAVLEERLMNAQLKYLKARKKLQDDYIKALKKAADYTARIAREQSKQSEALVNVKIDKNSIPFEQDILTAREAVKSAEDDLRIIKERNAALDKLEVRTAQDLLDKAKRETEEAEAQYELQRKKTALKKAEYGWAISAASQYAQTFGDTSSLTETFRSMFEDVLGSLRSGDFGTSGTIVGVVLDIFRGVAGSTAEQIKKKIQEVTGQVKFDAPVFSEMESSFEKALYPLLKEFHDLNIHIQKFLAETNKTARVIAETPLSFQGREYLSSLSSGGEGYNYSDTSNLGATSHSRTLIDSGLVIYAQTLRDAAREASLQADQYLSAQFRSSGFWGAISHTSTRREVTELTPEVRAALAESFNEGYQAIVEAGVALGFDRVALEEEVGSQVVSIDYASLFGLDKDALAKRLDEIFSEIFKGVIGNVEDFADLVDTFQQGTENDLQTLLRIAQEYSQASYALSLAGINITDRQVATIETRTAENNFRVSDSEVVAVENMTEAQRRYAQELLTSTGYVDGFTGAVTNLNGHLQEINTVNIDTIGSREQIIALVEQAQGLDNFNALIQNYTNNILTDEERKALQLQNLQNVFESHNLVLPETIQGYKNLLQAQNTATEEGRDNVLMMLQMADSFAAVRDSAEEAKDEISDYVDRITRAITGDLSPYTSDQQAAFMEQFAALQDTSTTEGATNYLDSLEAALRASKNSATTVEEYMRRFDAYIDAVQRVEKEKDITDLWQKAEDILEELKHQSVVQEQASYQAAL